MTYRIELIMHITNTESECNSNNNFYSSEVDVSTHPTNHIQLIDDHIPIATEVQCTFSVEISEENRTCR